MQPLPSLHTLRHVMRPEWNAGSCRLHSGINPHRLARVKTSLPPTSSPANPTAKTPNLSNPQTETTTTLKSIPNPNQDVSILWIQRKRIRCDQLRHQQPGKCPLPARTETPVNLEEQGNHYDSRDYTPSTGGNQANDNTYHYSNSDGKSVFSQKPCRVMGQRVRE